MLLPSSVPLGLSLVVIDSRPSPASAKVTRAFHVLDTHSGLPYTPAHVAVWFTTVHNGGERSGSCQIEVNHSGYV